METTSQQKKRITTENLKTNNDNTWDRITQEETR